MKHYPFALQLYSVRDYCERDPESTLHRVKGAGYDYVELAGFCGLGVDLFKTMLDRAELTPVSMHAGFELVVGDTEAIVQQANVLGLAYVVVPWLGKEVCATREQWVMAAESMNAAGEMLAESGITLCYHNHAHEFERIGSETIFDIIFANSDPELLKLELDTCWSTVGGADTVGLLRKYAGRTPLVHVKDCKPKASDGSIVFTELGNGVMDWASILPAAKAAGALWYIVEQDESEGDSLESAAVSAAFMKAQNK